MAAKCFAVNSYTVGWIAALYHERAAALEMLDEEYGTPEDFRKNDADANSYSWGCIGKHNVVIASLPSGEYGTAAAAVTATGLRASLPNVKIGLLVGIGAGITGEAVVNGVTSVKRRIFLGDVAVSNPSDANGGVVQHDVKKSKSVGGKTVYQLNGFLSPPPRALRGSLGNLRAQHERRDSRIEEFLEVFKKNKKMRKPYGYPGSSRDPLRKLLIEQAENGDAELSDDDGIRDSPEIHYGTIASGDELVKAGEERDSIIQWLQENSIDPICFEMEARGIMNSFPCLVIRGICDYADGRKNDTWQRYAAATAAAFAKEFLGYVDPQEVQSTRTIGEVIERVDKNVEALGVKLDAMSATIQTRDSSDEKQEVLDFLTTEDYGDSFNAVLRQHLEGTGGWFLESKDFSSWMSAAEDKKAGSKNKILYCTGAQGVGKTVLAARTIDHIQQVRGQEHAILYIFFDYGKRGAQTIEHILSALLRQMCNYESKVPAPVLGLYEDFKKTQRRPSFYDLTTALAEVLACLTHIKRTYIIADALDECEPSCCKDVVRAIGEWAAERDVRCLATSRDIPNINALFQEQPQLRIKAPDSDVEAYVRYHLSKLRTRVAIDEDLGRSIVSRVIEGADGLFLLARLHMESLSSKTNIRDIQDSLAKLPSGYSGAYNSAMERILGQEKELSSLATSVLTWVVNAKRPLLMEELQHALAVRPEDRAFVPAGLISPELLLSVCAGLIVEREELVWSFERGKKRGLVTVRFAHFTVREYFRETNRNWFPDANLLLARTCISYITFEKFTARSPVENVELGRLLCYHRLGYYANENWTRHAQDLELAGSNDDIQSLADTLLRMFRDGAVLIGPARLRRVKATLWHSLAEHNLARLFVCLLEKTPYTPVLDSRRRHPLTWAARHGNVSIMRALLASGLDDINSCDLQGRTAFWWAVSMGHVAVARLLLETDVGLANRADHEDRAPLNVAIEHGHHEMAELLCTTDDVDLNCFNDLGDTPLLVATWKGDVRTANLLLQSDKVHVNIRASDGETPLSRAAINGDEPIVHALLASKRVHPYMKSSWGSTPLLHALWMGRYRVQRLLLTDVDDGLRQMWSIWDRELRTHSLDCASIEINISRESREALEDHLRKTPDFCRHSVWVTYLHWLLRIRIHGLEGHEVPVSILEKAVTPLAQERSRLTKLAQADAEQILLYCDQKVQCYVCGSYPLGGGFYCPECAQVSESEPKANVCCQCIVRDKAWCRGAADGSQHRLQDFVCFFRTGTIPVPLRVRFPQKDCKLGAASLVYRYWPGSKNVVCDACGAFIASGLHCFECNSSDYDLCIDCVARGKWCFDIKHRLQEYGETELPRTSYPWMPYTVVTGRRASFDASRPGQYVIFRYHTDTYQRHTTDCITSSGHCTCIQDYSGLDLKRARKAVRTWYPWKLIAPLERQQEDE